MKRQILLWTILLFTGYVLGGKNVTFQVDMRSLIQNGYFSVSDGNRLVVRGNFNRWQGDDYELQTRNGENIFAGTYNLDMAPGDSLVYKFVIKRPGFSDYWERSPNPSNPDHGNRITVLTAAENVLPPASFKYDDFIHHPIVFNKDKLQQDYEQMRRIIEENHPALYDFTGKTSLDSLFDFFYTQIDTSMDFNSFYILLSSVLARIGCGHTKLWIPDDYWAGSPQNYFPLKILFNPDMLFVSGFFENTAPIPLGSRILSINDRPVKEIFQSLESITSSDGFIRAFKIKLNGRKFSRKYALYYGHPSQFHVSYIPPGTSRKLSAVLEPVDFETIKKYPPRGNTLDLDILKAENTALLTINTFIYYDQLDMFKSFTDSCFKVIKENGIKNLVLDLRGNDGGDPFCASYLFSYLQKKPVPYFSEPYGKYKHLADPLPMPDNHFPGRLYTLIDGGNFSTSGHFCALLKYHQIGKFVGSETGATYTCNGNVRYENLHHTRLILGTARERRYAVAVKNMVNSQGILPDYEVQQDPHDLTKGVDTVKEFVLDLIRKTNP
ncbi:hypothetical protein JW935_15235 [candidate division KSB1 bacterium]|nr:hypothetical protein [candidate division KSB1 bacterium]